jgi:hypothetical protein
MDDTGPNFIRLDTSSICRLDTAPGYGSTPGSIRLDARLDVKARSSTQQSVVPGSMPSTPARLSSTSILDTASTPPRRGSIPPDARAQAQRRLRDPRSLALHATERVEQSHAIAAASIGRAARPTRGVPPGGALAAQPSRGPAGVAHAKRGPSLDQMVLGVGTVLTRLARNGAR